MAPTYTHQAGVALAMYLKRGEDALEKLQFGDIDGALRLLSLRKAAFYNFRTGEYLGKTMEGYSIEEDDEAINLIGRINSIDKQLSDIIKTALSELEESIKTCSASKNKIGKFRSGTRGKMLFQDAV
ncbi:MAG: hypothetical protein HQK54_08165 [Oligoflexales bacterium]|nr:hypothetical protein [Oligoflexales bacterium]